MMRRVALDLEKLSVETFTVAEPQAPPARGSVQAYQADAPTMPVEYCFRSVFPTCGIYC